MLSFNEAQLTAIAMENNDICTFKEFDQFPNNGASSIELYLYIANSGRRRRAFGLGAIAALALVSSAVGPVTGSAFGCALNSFGGYGNSEKETRKNLNCPKF